MRKLLLILVMFLFVASAASSGEMFIQVEYEGSWQIEYCAINSQFEYGEFEMLSGTGATYVPLNYVEYQYGITVFAYKMDNRDKYLVLWLVIEDHGHRTLVGSDITPDPDFPDYTTSLTYSSEEIRWD